MKVEGRVGPITAASGTVNPLATDEFGNLRVVGGGGKYSSAVLEGRMFTACNATKVATTAGVAGTFTGLCISNLSTSSKNVIVHEFGWSLMIASDAAGTIGLMSGTIAAPAAGVTVHNCLDGESASLAVYADDGATIVTPLQIRTYGTYGTVATSSMGSVGPCLVDLKGSIVLKPGRTLATFTTLATTACFQFHFMWEEVDV
jgi:hypothetical protein